MSIGSLDSWGTLDRVKPLIRGNRVISVAKDGTGQFSTIKAAWAAICWRHRTVSVCICGSPRRTQRSGVCDIVLDSHLRNN